MARIALLLALVASFQSHAIPMEELLEIPKLKELYLYDGKHEVAAPPAIRQMLINAEREFLMEKLRECGPNGWISYNSAAYTYSHGAITVVQGNTVYNRPTQNGSVVAKNVLLFIPRTMGNAVGGIAYIIDRTVFGYLTFQGAWHAFESDPLQRKIEVDLQERGWADISQPSRDYLLKAVVLDNPEAIRNFMWEFYRKETQCRPRPL